LANEIQFERLRRGLEEKVDALADLATPIDAAEVTGSQELQEQRGDAFDQNLKKVTIELQIFKALVLVVTTLR
jgi:hypothetical protein